MLVIDLQSWIYFFAGHSVEAKAANMTSYILLPCVHTVTLSTLRPISAT